MSSSLPKKIPRPPNPFIIYRSFISERLPPPPPGTTRSQSEVSKIAGEMWRKESIEVKDEFRRKAALAKDEHAAKHPDYKYTWTRRAKEESKKEKGTQGEVVVDASEAYYRSDFDRVVEGSRGLHYQPALPEHSGNDFNVYLDYYDAAFNCYPPRGDDIPFPLDDFNVYPDCHDALFDYYSSLDNENLLSFSEEGACLTNKAQLQPQTLFGDEQETVLHTLQGLSVEQLMERYMLV
ncbi:hypothetical protein C0995_010325 [Termitomyces sp. Mi166|nr:hypothetical protein C0995_010325 [Termitomyces sp. Mi166\